MALLVILPGWGQSAEDWSSLNHDILKIESEIIELPGFGKTPLQDDTWGIPEYAGYVLERITRLNNSDIILLGHSFGGRIASYIAAQNPPWLRALILYGAPSIYRPSIKTKILNRMAKVAKKLGFSKKLSKNMELHAADKEGLGKIFRKAISFDQTATLPHIKVKTLLIWGENDTEAPLRLAQEIHELIPHNQLEIIDNAGHNLHISNQYIFYGKLKNFIQTV